MAVPQLSERLARIFQEIGISVTDQSPSSDCDFVTKGFCSRPDGGCDCLGNLDNQAKAGGISDDDLKNAARSMTRDAIAYGCNVVVKNI